MNGFWVWWDHGLNWIIFTAFFLFVEGVAIWNHHYTLSESFWLLLKEHEVLAILSLVIGLTCLIGHFLAGWWKG